MSIGAKTWIWEPLFPSESCYWSQVWKIQITQPSAPKMPSCRYGPLRGEWVRKDCTASSVVWNGQPPTAGVTDKAPAPGLIKLQPSGFQSSHSQVIKGWPLEELLVPCFHQLMEIIFLPNAVDCMGMRALSVTAPKTYHLCRKRQIRFHMNLITFLAIQLKDHSTF